MQQEIETFVNNCLHCLPARLNKKIPRPLASTTHGTFPNHVMRLDFIRLPCRPNSNKYIGALVMKDDASHFAWIVPVKRETARIVAKSLLQWASHSRMPLILCVDKGSHFINRIIERLGKHYNITILPTVASNKQTHGSAEIINRLIRRLLASLCSERRISTYDWIQVLPIVVHAINHTEAESLGGYAPVQLFTGQKPENPLTVHLEYEGDRINLVDKPLPPDFDEQVKQLQMALNNWQRVALAEAEKRRQRSRNTVNKARKEYRQFEKGDYVLRAVIEGSSLDRRRSKLQQRWIGPYQIIKPISNKSFQCMDLITGQIYTIDADNLYLYQSGTKEMNLDNRIYQQLVFDSSNYLPTKIIDIKVEHGNPFILLRWKGVASKKKTIRVWHKLNFVMDLLGKEKLNKMLDKLITAKHPEAKYMAQLLGRRC
jgi:hypothetical protein